jgi:hypothetical protein
LAAFVVQQLYTQEMISFGSKPKNIAWIKNKKSSTRKNNVSQNTKATAKA